MRTAFIYVAIFSLISLCSNLLHAELITVGNASFEEPELTDESSQGVHPSWVAAGAANSTGTWNPTTAEYPAEAPDGSNVAYSNNGTLYQILTATLTENTRYTLQVDVGRRLDITTLPSYQVQLYADTTLLAQDNNTLTPAAGTFETSVVVFDALPGDPNLGDNLRIQLQRATNSVQINWDDVRLNATVIPEPSSWALCLIAITLFAWRGAHRRRRA